MKFSKEFLQEEDWDQLIYDKIVGSGRWSIQHELVFRYKGKHYKTTFSRGATEYQEERPYDDQPDEIECPEVFPAEVMVTEYREGLS